MSELRWILIVCGALLLVAIYLWGRRSDKRADAGESMVRARPEPQVASVAAGTLEIDAAGDSPAEAAGYPGAPSQADGWAAEEPQPPPRPAPPVSRKEDPGGASPPRDVRRGRVEPTFSDDGFAESPAGEVEEDSALTAELPAREPSDAPTLSMSDTPAPRRIERRKIVALRLAASQRYPGLELRQAMEAEGLQHGRYEVFHRLHDDGVSIFSVASMVEPGTFDPARMAESAYPGVTLFTQLPGPIPGVHALQDLVACGKRLQERLGGTLQDERGVPLTVHRIERLRQEVVDFERGQARDHAHRSPASPSLP